MTLGERPRVVLLAGWLGALGCATPQGGPPAPDTPSTMAHAAPRCVDRLPVRVGPADSAVLLSGLAVDGGGRGLVTWGSREGELYTVGLLQPGEVAPTGVLQPGLRMSADDAAWLGEAAVVAGQTGQHSLASRLLQLRWPAGAPEARPWPAGDAPEAYRVRLATARAGDRPVALASVAAVDDPRRRAELGAVVQLRDPDGSTRQLWLLHSLESCSAAAFAPPGDTADVAGWRLLAACRGQDGSSQLVTLVDAGAPQLQPLDSDDSAGPILDRCLGTRAIELLDLDVAGVPWLGICASDSPGRCAVLQLPAEPAQARCLALPPNAVPDRLRGRDGERALVASREGGLWWIDLGRGEVQALREAAALRELPEPRPAISADGRQVLFGRHALEAGERATVQRVEVGD